MGGCAKLRGGAIVLGGEIVRGIDRCTGAGWGDDLGADCGATDRVPLRGVLRCTCAGERSESASAATRETRVVVFRIVRITSDAALAAKTIPADAPDPNSSEGLVLRPGAGRPGVPQGSRVSRARDSRGEHRQGRRPRSLDLVGDCGAQAGPRGCAERSNTDSAARSEIGGPRVAWRGRVCFHPAPTFWALPDGRPSLGIRKERP